VLPVGLLGLQLKVSAGDRAMLHVMDNAANRAKNAGECRKGQESSEQQADIAASTEFALHDKEVLQEEKLHGSAEQAEGC
jgi:hypothetical protein